MKPFDSISIASLCHVTGGASCRTGRDSYIDAGNPFSRFADGYYQGSRASADGNRVHSLIRGTVEGVRSVVAPCAMSSLVNRKLRQDKALD